MKRYSSYMDSGVEWIGEIPTHWFLSKFKYVSTLFTGNSLNDSQKSIYESDNLNELAYISSKDIDVNYHTVEYSNGIRIPKENNPFKIAPKGSFLLCVEGGSAGRKMAFLNQDVCFVNKLCCFRSNQVTRFQYYFIQSQQFQDKFKLSLSGLIGGVSISSLKDFELPLPSLMEQQKIVTFLDEKTQKIDTLIQHKERKIELLKEKRTALINHVVTKGLDPNVELKDSGVEWIGEIPVHWNLPKIKMHHETQSGGTPSSGNEEYYDGDFPWLRTLDINNDIVDNAVIFITEKGVRNSSTKLAPKNSILIAMYGGSGTIGKIGLLSFDSYINQALCAVLPNSLDSAKFLFYYLLFYNPYWMVEAQGTRRDPNIGQDVIRDARYPQPPIIEQNTIVEYLDFQTHEIDDLVELEQKKIDLLKEYRQSLISEVVTGKIRVCEEDHSVEHVTSQEHG